MRIAIAALFLPLFANSAFGWGCEGHQIIALIARAHLTPTASNVVDQLLRENPIDPALNRFCKDRPNDLMADSATWPTILKISKRPVSGIMWIFRWPLPIPARMRRHGARRWVRFGRTRTGLAAS